MATRSHVDSRRKYSWWWDSHISPKNSKWLQENLTDMDMKVKSMIKLLEEDADSFARRAEMYYKKRPELMKLVEEFYRAYRALAERYDHATGALRHAHKTMAEAFPNHVPFALIDDSPSGSLITDGEPRTPEMPPPIHAFAEPDDLRKDILGQSSHFHSIKKSGTFSEDSDALNGKRGLKQLNEMFTSGESTKQLKVAEGRVRQGLNFHEDESKTYPGPTDARKNGNGGRGKDDAYEDTSALQDEVSKLISENQSLKMQIKSENDHVVKCEDEIHRLQDSISKIEAEKEASSLQAQRYAESVSNLELEISHTRENSIKLHSEMANKLSSLETIEGQCLLLEAEKRHLEIQLKNLIEENNAQLQELQLKQIEIDKLKADAYLGATILEDKVSQLLSENQDLKVNIESEHDHVARCENRILSLEQSLSKSEADREDTLLLCQRSLEKISNLEMEVSFFQDDITRLRDEMAINYASLKTAEDKCLILEMEKQALELEAKKLSKEKNDQQNELQLKQIEIDKLKDDAYQITKNLQDEVSRLLSGNQVLRLQIESEHIHTTKCENEIQRLEESLSRSEADKNDAFQKYQMTVEKILKLEMEIASILEDNRKLNTEMDIKLERLECTEQQCLLLQKEKQTLEAEFKSLSQEKDAQQQELQQRQTEVDDLKYSLQEEHTKYSQIVVALRSLEQLHSLCLEKLGIRELELESGVEKLKDMEVKYHILEENIRCVKDINTSLTKELKLKEEEVTKLNLSLQGQLSSLIQAEDALRSVEMLHSQSLEEIETMTLDVQSKVEMLKEMELQKLHLEKEVQQLNEKIEKLNEQVVFSSLTMKSLQEEISNMKENIMKLENEVEHYVGGNKALQATIHSLQGQITELELKYQYILEQIKSIGLEEESFQASVRKLQDRNLELKDLCKMHEEDNNELMNKLENMEIITQKNTLLETSLADATSELEELRKKVNALEESCDSLNIEIARLISENGSLVAQLESINVTVEKLSKSNTFLETSLSDANVELEKLRSELKVLEESSQSLHDEKSNLQFEKIALVSQIQGLVSSLENIKQRYAELEGRHWHLEQDKESISTQVTVLHNLLKKEQHEHEAFALSSNTQLTNLANKMNILHIESQSKDRELEDLQSVLFNFEIQVFILQRCLLESKTCNQIQLASSRHLGQLLSDIKEENMEQKKSIEYIKHHVEELKKGIHIVYRSPDIYSPCNSSVTESKLGGQDVFSKILEVHNFISDTVEENHVLLLEKIIFVTLMQQLGSDLKILISEKNAMNLENTIGRQQLLALKSDKQELLMLNERLRESVHAGQLREDNLKTEMAVVGKQFLDLQDRNQESQAEIRILLEENKSLLNELSSLRVNIQNLEEENIVIFAEVINLSCLSLVLEQFSAERIMDLRICSRDLDSLHGINRVLDNKVKAMAENIVLIESEKMQLKSSAVELEDCKGRLLILENDLNLAKSVYQEVNNKVEQLMHKVEVTEGLVTMKEIELAEANKKNETTNNENVNLHRDLEVVKAELNEVMAVRKELEEKYNFLVDDNLQKDQEIGQVKKTSQMLGEMVQHLKKELIELGTSRQHLASELTYEIELYEEEASRLWTGIHVSTLHVDIFEEKLLDLLGECERLEISAIVQRNTLEEQIGLNSFYTDQLKQKLNYLERESGILGEKLNAYLPLVVSLQNSVASLGKQTLSFIRLKELDGYSGQNASQVRVQHTKIPPQLSADFNAIELDGIQGLKKLLSRVEELQKVLMDCTLMLQVPIPDSKSASPNGLQHERTFCMDELPEHKNATSQLEIRSEQDAATEPYNAGIPKGGYGLVMKDIQLDKSSHDIVSSLPKRSGEDAKVDDQMLKLWETAEHDSSNVVLGASSLTTTDDRDYRQIEPVEEEKSQYPSQPVAEKELVVDRLRISKKVDSYQEWNRRIMERLSSDAQRLSVLQDSVQELKAQLEKSENSDIALSVKCEAMRRQLQRAEEAILGLVDVNTNLTKKAENCSPSFDDNSGEDNARRQQRRQVSDHALKGSEKIVRLELEVQKIQYVLLKLDEERENRNKAAQATSRIVLRDYLYGRGRRENHRRKRGHFCGCMRPKASED